MEALPRTAARTLLLLLFCTAAVQSQICRISVAGLNRNRKVMGAIHAECPSPIHTAPFGNWGVTSNFGQKGDSHQFDGWCHNTRVCDNNGTCIVDCRDGWYEWNSCTDIPLYSAPNCTLYNADECTKQVTTTGINVHGTRILDIPVRCPTDTNQDGIADQGGCADASTYRSGTNFMSLYELDPGTGDELVQTVYFPEVVMQLQCDQWNCAPMGSDWMSPSFWDSPASPAKVTAEFAALINSATFIDSSRACRSIAPVFSAVNAASFSGPAVAPDSIATLLGRGLATGAAQAASAALSQELAGTRVTVTDATGAARPALLSYVSPDQVNFVIPAATAPGAARIAVSRTDTVAAAFTVQVTNTAPGIFTANSNGSGVPAALGVRVNPAGAHTAVPVLACGNGAGTCAPVPIDLGPAGDRVFISLYGTGIRRAPNAVSVSMGGVPSTVTFAGPQTQYPGLDQVNVLVPPELRGRGLVELRLEQNGVAANTVLVAIQ